MENELSNQHSKAAFTCNCFNYSQLSNKNVSDSLKNCINENRKLQLNYLNEIRKLNSFVNLLTKHSEIKTKHCVFTRINPYFQDDQGKSPYSNPPLEQVLIWMEDKKFRQNWSKEDVENLRYGLSQYNIVNPQSGNNSADESVIIDSSDVTFLCKNIEESEVEPVSLENNDLNSSNEDMPNIDFKLISSVFVKNHSPLQCKLYWINNVGLDSSCFIWTEEDDNLLLNLANKYHCRNWFKIGEELDRRNALQTFIHYRRNLDKQASINDRIESINRLNLGLHFELNDFPPIDKSYRRLTSKEKMLIMTLGNIYGQDCWYDVCHLFLSRSPLYLKRSYQELIRQQDFNCFWTAEKDLKLIKVYQKFDGMWDLISKALDSISETICKKRYEFLCRNIKNNIWQVGLQYTLNKNYSEVPIFKSPKELNNNDSDTIRTKADVEINDFKRLWGLTMIILKNKYKGTKKKLINGEEKWCEVILYLDKCMKLFKTCLYPDIYASNWRTRYEIVKVFNKLPKNDVYQMLDHIQPEGNNLVFYEEDYKFLYSKNISTELKTFDDIKSITIKLFGNSMFDETAFGRNTESCEIKPKENDNICHSDIQHIQDLLIENELILQHTDLSRFQKHKRKSKK